MGTVLPTAIAANIAALNANTGAVGGKGIGELADILKSTGALGTIARFTGGLGAGVGGTAIGTGITAAIGGNITNAMIGGGIGTALGTAAIALAPETFGTSLLIPLIASGIASVIGGQIGKEKAVGGLVTGPGTATSDNILTPTSPGEFVVNAKATDTYGTNFLNSVNKGTYQPQASAVSVDMSRVEAKLEILAKDTTVAKLVDAIGKIKINMSGYEVGNVALNDRSPLYTASPSQAV